MQTPNSSAQFKKTMLILWSSLLFSQIVIAMLVFSMRFADFSIEEMFYFDQGKLPFIVIALMNGVASFAVLLYFRRQALQDGALVSAQKFQVGHLIAWALTESITLFGLVVAMTRNSNSFVPFFFVSMAVMIIHFPKELFSES